MDFRVRGDGASSRPTADQLYFTPSPAHRHLGLYCLGVGWQDGTTAPVPSRVLDSYAAVLVHGGQGTLSSGLEPAREVDGPTLFWLFPGLTHSYAPDLHGWSESWVLFGGFGVHGYETLGYLDRSRALNVLERPEPVAEVFDRLLHRCMDTEPGVEVAAATLVHELIMAVAESTPTLPARDEAVALTRALRAEACTSLTVAQHARRLRVSVGDLRAAVRRATGSTPKDLLVQARVSQAKRMLADTDLSVAQIGRAIGYDDAAYFSRIFTRQAGSPPSEFRRAQARWAPADSG